MVTMMRWVVVIAVVFSAGCEKKENSGGSVSPMPLFSSFTGFLVDKGYTRFHDKPGNVNPKLRRVLYVPPKGTSGAVEVWRRGDEIVRLQLSGGPSKLETKFKEMFPSEWPDIWRLPGTREDYMKGLTAPHRIGRIAVTLWCEQHVVEGRYAYAMILWPAQYYEDEVADR